MKRNTNKGLITESQASRWAKLANLKGSKFLKESFEPEEEEDELEGMGDEGDMDGDLGAGADEMPPAPTEPEMGGDLEGGAGLDGAPEDMVQNLVSAIADAIEAETGVGVEVDGASTGLDDDTGDDLDPDVGDMDAMDDMGGMDDMSGDEDMSPDLGDAGEEDDDMPLNESRRRKAAILAEAKKKQAIKEIAKRVAARLNEKKKR